ncbi:MAG: zinc-ribbon domain-containing protein [Desulfovibrionaceae bacterium]|nr:zinc-ribbon domain-containing protein [Desulfovibrionaceae bacterium]
MLIQCPKCHFGREIPDQSVPPTATMATCPKCGERFNFRQKSQSAVASAEQEASSVSPVAESSHKHTPADSSPSVQLPIEKTALHVQNEEIKDKEDHPDDLLPPGAIIENIVSSEQQLSNQDAKPQPDSSAESQQAAEDIHEETKREQSRTAKKAASTSSADSESFLRNLWKKPDPQRKSDIKVPWDRPSAFGWLRALYLTVAAVLSSPARFFSGLGEAEEARGSLLRPALFYCILGLLQYALQFLWGYAALTGSSGQTSVDPQMEQLLQTSSDGLFLIAPILLCIQMLIFSFVYYGMFRLVCPDPVRFAVVARVIAYSASAGVLYAIPIIGGLAAPLCYAMFTFIGCRYALRISWGKTALALVPVYMIAIGLTVQVLRQIMAGALG